MNITKDKVIAFFEDRCSAEEAEVIHQFLEQNPEWMDEHFSEAEWMTFEAAGAPPQEWSQKLWKKIQQGKAPGHLRRIYLIGGAVAAIAILLIGLFGLKRYAARQEPHPVAIIQNNDRDTVITNQTNDTVERTLTDGSKVTLYPTSSLTLRWPFEHDKRVLSLLGGALFDVAPDGQRPFVVLTPGFSTTVLGTVFEIKSYPGQETAVRLLKGRVVVRSLSGPSRETYLTPGQTSAFSRPGNGKVEPSARPEPVSAPPVETEKEIVFNNTPLSGVLTTLSTSYHTPIQFTDADLRKRKYTGTIRKDQSLDKALNTIALLNDLQITRQGDGYRIALRP